MHDRHSPRAPVWSNVIMYAISGTKLASFGQSWYSWPETRLRRDIRSKIWIPDPLYVLSCIFYFSRTDDELCCSFSFSLYRYKVWKMFRQPKEDDGSMNRFTWIAREAGLELRAAAIRAQGSPFSPGMDRVDSRRVWKAIRHIRASDSLSELANGLFSSK